MLVHHPYDSFATSVEEFIRQARDDPKVLAIKLTLYRTSGDSPIVKSLIRAAERGKQVAALVELKARFDEQPTSTGPARSRRPASTSSTGWSASRPTPRPRSSCATRPTAIRRYCHVGTGNYNPKTARLYEDLGLLTADPRDRRRPHPAVQLPHRLRPRRRSTAGCWWRRDAAPRHPRAHPTTRRRRHRGRIIIKMNSLVDPDMIDELYAASQAGVQIDLIVRGICCLRPGVPGLSENIRVRSHHRSLPRALPDLPLRQRRRRDPQRPSTTSARPT